MHLETLEERALFAGVQEALEPVDSIDEVKDGALCYGVMGTVGQYAATVGQTLEVPGAWVQAAGDSIYTFFDTEHGRRSLGNFAILELIEETRRLGGDFLYLGYWISHCQKMNYKIDYRPMELLIDGSWKRLV